jgi:hypothetical protein
METVIIKGKTGNGLALKEEITGLVMRSPTSMVRDYHLNS